MAGTTFVTGRYKNIMVPRLFVGTGSKVFMFLHQRRIYVYIKIYACELIHLSSNKSSLGHTLLQQRGRGRHHETKPLGDNEITIFFKSVWSTLWIRAQGDCEKLVVGLLCSFVVVLFSLLICCVPVVVAIKLFYYILHQVKVLQKPIIKEFF